MALRITLLKNAVAARWLPRSLAANRYGLGYRTGRCYPAPRIYGASRGLGRITAMGPLVTGPNLHLESPFLLTQERSKSSLPIKRV